MPKASPIRDKITEFLSQPRAAREIAAHIDPPVPVATGHLAAMCRQGLAQRIGRNAYACGSYSGPPMCFRGRPKENRLRRQLKPLLLVRSSPIGPRCQTGASIEDIRKVLREMWLTGEVIGNEETGFIRKKAER